MINFASLQDTLTAHFDNRITHINVLRGNELHFQIARGEVLRLATYLRDEFNARLILMVGNDRRADKGVFEVHYLFANDNENWFVHATKYLPEDDANLDSMATFYL